MQNPKRIQFVIGWRYVSIQLNHSDGHAQQCLVMYGLFKMINAATLSSSQKFKNNSKLLTGPIYTYVIHLQKVICNINMKIILEPFFFWYLRGIRKSLFQWLHFSTYLIILLLNMFNTRKHILDQIDFKNM